MVKPPFEARFAPKKPVCVFGVGPRKARRPDTMVRIVDLSSRKIIKC